MKRIALIVEGDGEVEALRVLLRRMNPSAQYSRPFNTKGRGTLETDLDRLLERVRREKPDGLIILQDADEDCPWEIASEYAARASKLGLPFPVSIVVARCEFEAWFIASIETIAGNFNIPAGTGFEGNVESVRDAKGWLTKQMDPMHAYKPTTDQVKMVARIDLDLVGQRSRSFRRLEHALTEVLSGQSGTVTPPPKEKQSNRV